MICYRPINTNRAFGKSESNSILTVIVCRCIAWNDRLKECFEAEFNPKTKQQRAFHRTQPQYCNNCIEHYEKLVEYLKRTNFINRANYDSAK